MMPITQAQVLSELAHHIGQASGVHVRDLVTRITGQQASCGFLERRVRAVITELRLEGVQVCAHPANGYFIAETAAELEDTCAFLRSRAMSSLVIESRLRRIGLPELLGQLNLPT